MWLFTNLSANPRTQLNKVIGQFMRWISFSPLSNNMFLIYLLGFTRIALTIYSILPVTVLPDTAHYPAAVTQYHRLGGLNNIHLFLIVPEGRKSNIQILVDLVPGKHLLSGIQTTTFMLCPYRTKTERQSVCPGLSSSSYKDTKARMKVPP